MMKPKRPNKTISRSYQIEFGDLIRWDEHPTADELCAKLKERLELFTLSENVIDYEISLGDYDKDSSCDCWNCSQEHEVLQITCTEHNLQYDKQYAQYQNDYAKYKKWNMEQKNDRKAKLTEQIKKLSKELEKL